MISSYWAMMVHLKLCICSAPSTPSRSLHHLILHTDSIRLQSAKGWMPADQSAFWWRWSFHPMTFVVTVTWLPLVWINVFYFVLQYFIFTVLPVFYSLHTNYWCNLIKCPLVVTSHQWTDYINIHGSEYTNVRLNELTLFIWTDGSPLFL